MSITSWFESKKLAQAKKEVENVKDELVTALNKANDLTREIRGLKNEVEDLKLKKKIEEEDIKHLTKIKLEQNEIEYQRKVMLADKKADDMIMTVKQAYADKMQERLEIEVKNIKEMYGQILQRL